MKLQESNYGFEGSIPSERIHFAFDATAKLFDILSSGIYKDKILAVIRELSCNAYDAHIVAKKKHVPFRLRLPSRLDPTFYVEDEGTGIDPAEIGKIYWTYGRSSKTNCQDQIGALGLGSKSPFAYTKSSFVVKNRYEGHEYIYLCFINENGMPDGSLVSQEKTDKLPGVTVEFAVRPEDITPFFERTGRFFKRWEATLPTFIDCDITLPTITKIIEGTDWYLEKADGYADHSGAIAMMGNVPYPIEVDSIPNMPKDLEIIAKNPFIITFDMGEINFAASRETLQYDERTCANIIARLQEVCHEVEISFKAKVFAPGMTHIEFITNFRKTFQEFITTIKYNNAYSARQSSDSEKWYCKMLIGKSIDDVVLYDGLVWNIEQLISNVLVLENNGHKLFSLYKNEQRSNRSSRRYVKQLTMVVYAAVADVDGQLIHPTWSIGSLIHAETELRFDWKSTRISNRAEPTDYTRVLANNHLFDVSTIHKIPVSSTMIFYINDVGSSGEARYKAFGDTSSFFVNYDSKTCSLNDVKDQLNSLINLGLKGSEIRLMSTAPDLRPTIEKEKIETGKIRLKYCKVIFHKNDYKLSTNGGCVNIKKVYNTLDDEAIIPLSELQAEDTVLYVIKRRSPKLLFDYINSHSYSIIKNNEQMALAAKYVFPDLLKIIDVPAAYEKHFVGHQSLKVLVLNEGQIAWLKKRKVKLVGLRELIETRILAMQETEKFKEKIQEVSVLSNLDSITALFESTAEVPKERERLQTCTSESLFKEIFSQYVVIKSTAAVLQDQYAKMMIYEYFKGTQNQGTQKGDLLEQELDERYPLLSLCVNNGLDKSKLKAIIDYIEQIDFLFKGDE